MIICTLCKDCIKQTNFSAWNWFWTLYQVVSHITCGRLVKLAGSFVNQVCRPCAFLWKGSRFSQEPQLPLLGEQTCQLIHRIKRKILLLFLFIFCSQFYNNAQCFFIVLFTVKPKWPICLCMQWYNFLMPTTLNLQNIQLQVALKFHEFLLWQFFFGKKISTFDAKRESKWVSKAESLLYMS